MTAPSKDLAPLVTISAALILGSAFGGPRPSPAAAGIASLLFLSAATGLRRRRGLARLAAALAAVSVGAALQGWAWRDAERRLTAGFGASPRLAIEVTARILGAPERDRQGGRALEVVTIEPGSVPELRLRLDIAPVPAEEIPRIDGLRRGDTIRVWCRLRAPTASPGTTRTDARRRLAAQRLDALGRVKSSRLVRLVESGRWTPARTIDDARADARGALDRAVGADGEARAVLGAMVIGDRLLLDDDTNALLRNAGLVHILSISGLHTALTIVLFLALLRRAGLGARDVLIAGTTAILAFAAFVGHGASVWRACAGLFVGLVARWASRDVDPLAGLALATALLVVAVPPLAWSAGFLLSVLATAGLVSIRPHVAETRTSPSTLFRAIAASTGAYLATAPLLAITFGRLAPVALLANLAAAPLCVACLASGAGAIVFSSFPLMGSAAACLARGSVASLLLVSKLAVAVPGGHLRVAPPPTALTAAYVALLLVAWRGPRALGRGTARGIRLLFTLCAIALHLGPPPPATGPAAVEVVDVGQGLAVILRGEDGRFALVDAGPSGNGRFDAGDQIVVPRLAGEGCRRLDVLALSHDHDDHAGGARTVLRDMDVGELWLGQGSENDPLTRAVAAEAVAKGVAVRRLKRGDRAARAGLAWDVLHPAASDRRRSLNDRCLVLRATTASAASVLLPGDLEAEGERALLASGADPRASALVAPHHGADGSSTASFLSRVGADVVLISAGEGNRFGHPGAHALARFAATGARIYRTDRGGTISLGASGPAWRASLENDGGGDERQDEDQTQDGGDREATGAERLRLVEETGMPVSQPEEHDEPEGVRGGSPRKERLAGDERRDSDDRGPREPPVRAGRDREDGVAPVELTDGKQVHRRDQHPHPRRAVDRSDLQIRVPVKRVLQEPRGQGRAEPEPERLVSRGNDGRARDPDDHER